MSATPATPILCNNIMSYHTPSENTFVFASHPPIFSPSAAHSFAVCPLPSHHVTRSPVRDTVQSNRKRFRVIRQYAILLYITSHTKRFRCFCRRRCPSIQSTKSRRRRTPTTRLCARCSTPRRSWKSTTASCEIPEGPAEVSARSTTTPH